MHWSVEKKITIDIFISISTRTADESGALRCASAGVACAGLLSTRAAIHLLSFNASRMLFIYILNNF